MTIMRFKRGNKVEVFGQKDVPTGSWRCAEIICGNGHYYTVKYDEDVSCSEEMSERVPRKMIRPCPPLMKVNEIWVPHDVVEVFHCFSWKMATIVKVLPMSEYLVRLLGSSHEFKVTIFDLRARLCWQGDEWVAIGKGCDISQDWRPNVPSNVRYNQNSGLLTVNEHVKDGCLVTRNISSIPESQAVPSRTLKRRFPFCDTAIESYAGPHHKMRVNEKESMDLQFVSMQHSQFAENVDAFAYSGKSLGAKCTHRSFKSRITGCPETICEKEKVVGDVECSRVISLESRDGDSNSSSVGSCSISRDYPYELPHAFSTVPFEDNDSHCSDAESFCRLGFEEGNCLLHSDEQLTAEIHRATARGLPCFQLFPWCRLWGQCRLPTCCELDGFLCCCYHLSYVAAGFFHLGPEFCGCHRMNRRCGCVRGFISNLYPRQSISSQLLFLLICDAFFMIYYYVFW